MANPVIVWFRQDLRLSDNPALSEAVKSGLPVIPIYVLDDDSAAEWKMGGASRVWLHHSLHALDKSLQGKLRVFKGKADILLPKIIQECQASSVYWNRCYEPWRINRDKKIKEGLSIPCHSFNSNLLWEPWEIQKSDGTPYRVFTPFYRKGCLSATAPRKPLPLPSLAALTSFDFSIATKLDKIGLLPQSPRWDKGMVSHWTIGETGAQKRLSEFLDVGLKGYKEGRNFPAKPHISRLSPYLHYGEISPHQVWYQSIEAGLHHKAESDLDHFHSELGWREFSNSLLYFNPDLPSEPLNKKFKNFDWAGVDGEWMERWKQGRTGYPIVDAGMRELYATGYMHNRVRMIVASFLVKDFRYHWRLGEDWFWDTLFDADLANNSASWQWVAGCGADAAPYFRIFNPTTQGEKFDPMGEYIRQWAPDSVKIKPILDHSEARDKALEAFKNMSA
jgi:deoxyribodipyrimidine photo-lyase